MFKIFVSILCAISAVGYSNEGNIRPVTQDVPRIAGLPNTNSQLTQLDDLISATQRSLEQLTTLRGLIITFQETQKAYLKSDDDVELLIKMIKIAKRSQDIITENHLSYALDPELIKELDLFAKMANKRGIPKS